MDKSTSQMTSSEKFQFKEQRKRLGSAVDKSDKILETSSTSDSWDDLNKGVQTDDLERNRSRVFLQTKKGKLCLGILLGVLLSGIVAGIIIWYLLDQECEREKAKLSKDIKQQDRPIKMWNNCTSLILPDQECEREKAQLSKDIKQQGITIDEMRREMKNQNSFEHMSCIGDICYFFEETKVPWAEARDGCKAKGKTLAEVHSQDQADQLALIYKLHYGSKLKATFWLGAYEDDSDKWVWLSSSDNVDNGFENWTTGKPDAGECMGQWVNDNGDPGWDDYYCTTAMPYLCQSQSPAV